MNITDAVQFQRQRAVLQSEGALSLLAPAAATGLLVSIGDVFNGRKPVKQTLLLNSAFNKIKAAVKRANRDGVGPKIELEAEESGALEMVLQMAKSGLVTAIELVGEALFSFVPFCIEMVVVPMVTMVSWTVMSVLPLILTPEGLIAAGLAVGGYMLYKKWREWKEGVDPGSSRKVQTPGAGAVPSSTVPETSLGGKLTEGLRNNNPGNLVYAHQPSSLATSGHFAQFSTQGQGLYNMGRQLELYSSRGINTVDKIVRNWSHTDQDAYVKNVAKALGVDPGDKLDLSNQGTVEALMKAIIIQENGYNPYSDAQIAEAARQALGFASNGYKDQVASGSMVMPATGIVTSPFGHRGYIMEGASTEHKGVDIGGKYGSSVVAATDGTVEVAGPASGYGTLITIRGSDLITRYGHLSAVSVKVGDKVTAGQEIGKMGNEGVSTGPHLHFETQPVTASAPVDPGTYLSGLRKGTAVAAGGSSPGGVASVPKDVELVNRDKRLIALT